MKIFITLLLCLPLQLLVAQQLPRINQYLITPEFTNPGAVGTKGFIDAKTSYRAQWSGVEGAPRTGFVSVNAPIKVPDRKNYHGVGGHILYDKAGAWSNVGGYVSYAYHFVKENEKSKMTLSAGANFGIVDYSLNTQEMILFDPDDPAANTAPRSSVADANFGILLTHNIGFIGVSLNQIINDSLRTFNANARERHISAMAGLLLAAGDYVAFIPSVMYQSSPNDSQLAVGGTFKFENKAWIGLTHTLNNATAINAGFNYNDGYQDVFMLSYAYEFNNSVVGQINSGSHEITLGLRFPAPNETRKNQSIYGDPIRIFE